ncbi:MAG: hypothetical protein JG765_39 [Cereibacter sp.]|jgi:hypothetical protein|nr:hypothetical protein [Cereibacter sp.]
MSVTVLAVLRNEPVRLTQESANGNGVARRARQVLPLVIAIPPPVAAALGPLPLQSAR